jgi:uncharacterized protein (TIGR03086 family)
LCGVIGRDRFESHSRRSATAGSTTYDALMNDANAQVGMQATDALDLFIDAVDQTPPESWEQPSNLEGWSLRDLVSHAIGSATKMVTLIEGGEVWTGPSAPADWACEDRVARLRELAARLRDALPGADLDAMRSSPFGEAPLHQVLTFPVSDLAVHAWDLHRSQGQFVDLPDDLLALCRGLVESVPADMMRRPGGFGPARPAPPDSTPTAGLMAYLGRSVD